MAVVAASLVGAPTVDAQIVRRPEIRRVPNWGGASVGLTQGYSIRDGSTGSTWAFGSGLEYAARFEHPTRSGIAVGLQASFASMPLSYGSSTFNGDATARVTQFMGILHYGGGYTFHPVYELAAGVVGFSNFRSNGTTPTPLSSSTDYDPKISIGYGFGFGISSTFKIELVQELGTIIHQRDGLSGSSSSFPRVYVTRIGGKVAF
jgi:hypothetical protein